MIQATNATETAVLVRDTTYRIVEDLGNAYIVERSRPNGELAFHFKVPSPEWGKSPVLGDEPLGEIFPVMTTFGFTTIRGECVYSRRDWSRWKAFLDWGIHDRYSPEKALRMVRKAGLKWIEDHG